MSLHQLMGVIDMNMNQKGMTLVELVAGLALVAIVATIAWTTLMIGMQHGTAETSKTIMQQEANLMVSSLMAVHRGSEKYSIIFDDNQLKLDYCDKSGVCGIRNIAGKYDFTGTKINDEPVDISAVGPVVFADLEPEKSHTKIILKITDLKNPKRTLTINTTLSRLLTDRN